LNEEITHWKRNKGQIIMKLIFLSRYGFQNLLFVLLLYLLAGPLLDPSHFVAHLAGTFLLSTALILAVYVIHKRIKLPFATLPLLVIVMGLMWLEKLGYIPYSEKAMNLLLCLYLFFIVYSFLLYIFSVKQVESNLICATLCLYLFLGLLWGTIFGLLELFIPGSFAGEHLSSGAKLADKLHHFIYFSFITLTTLGYGDVLPQTPLAASFCQVEAILGQFFTAVLVARLVGIQVAQQFMEKP
jgi:voltage-gated potassium channel